MNREELKNVFKLIIGIALIVLAVKFFIYLLPIILVVFFGYYLYDFYKKTKNQTVSKVNNEKKRAKKNSKVHEAYIVREKND